jgi:endonuclease YncB( thermonuclease family)
VDPHVEALRRDPTATATDVELLERLIGRADEEADRPNRKTDRQGARARELYHERQERWSARKKKWRAAAKHKTQKGGNREIMPRHYLFISLAIVAAFGLGTAASSLHIPLVGQARVIDGDTIVVGPTHVRLQGVDAPELSDPAGQHGKELMQQIVGDHLVVCVPDGTRSYERVVAVCYVDWADIGAEIIRVGGASDCPHYSHGRYALLEVNHALPHAHYCGDRS